MNLSTTLKLVFILFLNFQLSFAQTSDTPIGVYEWKGNKTKAESGYVILKSGKRLDGTVSLKGSVNQVIEVNFEGDGKKISFPVAALQAYGINRKPSTNLGSASSSSSLINDSPESMYEWRDGGIVMGKVIETTKPREGYVVLKNGTKVSGMLKLKKKDGVLSNYEIKDQSKKKIKGDISEVARYGYTVSEGSVAQANLEDAAGKFYSGTLKTNTGIFQGQLSQLKPEGKFYSEKVILKTASGQLTEYTPAEVSYFTQNIKGSETRFMAVENAFVQQKYDGTTFVLYRNPFPTTINEFATSLAKTGMQAGTAAIASEAIKKDEKDNDYSTNLDSLIRVSSDDELREIRDGFVQLGGYSSADELLEKSDNESLKTNVSAIEIALAGREAASSEGGILNIEWVILNKNTGEKTIVYKSDYKKLVEPLLKGCYDYLSMSRSEQKTFEKWNTMTEMVQLLDKCY